MLSLGHDNGISKNFKLRGVRRATLCLSISCHWWSLVRAYTQSQYSVAKCSTVQCSVVQGQHQRQDVHSVHLSNWLTAPPVINSCMFLLLSNFRITWNTSNTLHCSTSVSPSIPLSYCQFIIWISSGCLQSDVCNIITL